jgi:hypothetical protein
VTHPVETGQAIHANIVDTTSRTFFEGDGAAASDFNSGMVQMAPLPSLAAAVGGASVRVVTSGMANRRVQTGAKVITESVDGGVAASVDGATGRVFFDTDAEAGSGFAERSVVDIVPDSAPVAYGTPYRQLTQKARSELLKKVEDRTVTRDEWTRLQWNRRLTERRQEGIDAFWAQERQDLSQGLSGSRNWSPEAAQAISEGGTTRGIFGHHKFSVSLYPQLANDPTNIAPTTYYEHFYKWHGGNWRNATHGVPLRPDLPDYF